LGLPSGLFPQDSPPKPCIHPSCPPYVLRDWKAYVIYQ
jgi:hypothetical protein